MGTAETQQLTGIAAHIIKRPRLTKILDETEARIILLCAPAGYGKTTLAREWVATRSEPVYWYSGGPAMADVAALAVDLAELVGRDEDAAVAQTRMLASRSGRPRKLAATIGALFPTRSILVIDDYHLAQADADAEALIEEVAGASTTRLLITSRVRPKWISGRRIVYGEILILEQDSLAFTADEANEVLPGAFAAHDRARGWPAVIGLAAITGDSQRLPGDIPAADLYDFIATDLIGGVSTSFREALLKLAAGADRSPRVARRLFGRGLDALLDEARTTGFVTRRADGWIEMHPLLRAFLLGQLRHSDQAISDQLVTEVLSALVDDNDIDGSLELLRAFPNPRVAEEILRQHFIELLAAGRLTSVTQWIELAKVPGEHSGVILLAEAEVALRRGSDSMARALANEAAAFLAGDLAARANLTAARAAHQADDVDAAAESAARAEQLATTPALRTEALWVTFANAYERDPGSMRDAFERLKGAEDARPEHSLRLASAEGFMWFGPDGDLLRALKSAERAVALSTAVGDPLIRTNATHFHAQMLRACGRYREALASIPALLEDAESTGLDFVVDHALLAKSAALIGVRSLDAARRTLRLIAGRGDSSTPHVQRNVLMLHARLRIAAGDLQGAEVLLQPEPQPPLAVKCEYLSLRALVAAAAGNETLAEASLDDAAQALQYAEARMIAEMARAILDARQGHDAHAVASHVKTVLDRGGVDTVVTACRAWSALAGLAVEGGVGAQLQTALALSHDRDIGRRAGLQMPRELSEHQLLSSRELEVLELLVAGRSNPEIARILFIGESTAKVHVRHIFEKLGVRSRAEAVAVGAEMLRS